jgi:hypothetical protein
MADSFADDIRLLNRILVLLEHCDISTFKDLAGGINSAITPSPSTFKVDAWLLQASIATHRTGAIDGIFFIRTSKPC